MKFAILLFLLALSPSFGFAEVYSNHEVELDLYSAFREKGVFSCVGGKKSPQHIGRFRENEGLSSEVVFNTIKNLTAAIRKTSASTQTLVQIFAYVNSIDVVGTKRHPEPSDKTYFWGSSIVAIREDATVDDIANALEKAASSSDALKCPPEAQGVLNP